MEKIRNQIATEWWLKKLSAFDESTIDNGEEDKFLKKLMILNKLNSRPLTTKENEIFSKKLSKHIDKQIKKFGYCIISVDYHPNGILAELAEELDISDSLFPIKTIMWVYEEKIQVRSGYSANIETIYEY